MSDYTFYTNPMSRGQIARWALHEAGADYRQELVDWTDKSPEFLRVNPMGKVPTLVHHHAGGDRVVTEAAAICHYLAEAAAPALLPRDEEKADYFRYLFFAAGPVEQGITAKLFGWQVPEGREATPGFGSYDRTIDTLETMVTDRDYVCGSRFTMADVYFGSQVDWGLAFGTIPTRPGFEAYAARLRARDAYRAAKAIDMDMIEKAQA